MPRSRLQPLQTERTVPWETIAISTHDAQNGCGKLISANEPLLLDG